MGRVIKCFDVVNMVVKEAISSSHYGKSIRKNLIFCMSIVMQSTGF